MPDSASRFYDQFSDTYDRFVAWKPRLKNETPFFRKLFKKNRVRRVLDVACGTGMHAIALANQGYEVVGADISEGMVHRARENALRDGATAEFVVAGFGGLRQILVGDFDAVLCLGNSLPHLLSEAELSRAIGDIFAVLRPGGIFIGQNLNFDKICGEEIRFMSLSPWRAEGHEGLFFRFLDFHPATITFNVVAMNKEKKEWSFAVHSTEWRPIYKADFEDLLRLTGFADLSFYADYQGHPWQPGATRDLIVVATKPPFPRP